MIKWLGAVFSFPKEIYSTQEKKWSSSLLESFLGCPTFSEIHAWVGTAVDDRREGLLMTSFRLLMTKPLSKMSSKLLKTSLEVLKLIHCNKKVINLAAWMYHQDKMLSAESPCCCLSASPSPFLWRASKEEIHPFPKLVKTWQPPAYANFRSQRPI